METGFFMEIYNAQVEYGVWTPGCRNTLYMSSLLTVSFTPVSNGVLYDTPKNQGVKI